MEADLSSTWGDVELLLERWAAELAAASLPSVMTLAEAEALFPPVSQAELDALFPASSWAEVEALLEVHAAELDALLKACDAELADVTLEVQRLPEGWT